MKRLLGGKKYIQDLVGAGTDAGNVPAVMGALAKKFANMPYVRAKIQANMIGIDDNTLQAMIRDGGKYYNEYQKLVKRAGVNEDKLAEDSQSLMVKVRSLGETFTMLGKRIQQVLIAALGPVLDEFKKWIEASFDDIVKVAKNVGRAILGLSLAIGRFVKGILEWYSKLDPQSQSLVKTILGITAAVWLFNKAFGASPVGNILSLASAIAILYDDYQNWKKTGEKGLVDWDKWEPVMLSVIGALETISGWFIALAGDGEGGIGGLQAAMALFAGYMATTWALSLLSSIAKVRGGLIGLGVALLAESAYNIYDTYNKVSGPQDEAFKNWTCPELVESFRL